MLKTLTEKQKLSWKDELNKLVFAYNCTKSEVTGFSPFYLMFGRSPRLPVDALFGLNPNKGSIDHSEYVERWTKGMQEAYEIASEHANKCTERNKRNYDQKVRCTSLCPGSRVLVKNLAQKGGPGKLWNFWENEFYIVIRQAAEDTPIYEVKPEQGKGRSRVLHHNHLLTCDHLPQVTTQTQNATLKRKHQKKSTALPAERREEHEPENDSESDDEYYVQVEPYQFRTQPNSHNQMEKETTSHLLHTSEKSSAQSEQMLELTVLPHLAEQEQNVIEHVDLPAEERCLPERRLPVEERRLPDQHLSEHHLPVQRNPTEEPSRIRQRRPPKRFTYENVGTPTCYSVQNERNDFNPHPTHTWTPNMNYWVPQQIHYSQPSLIYYTAY